MIEVFFGIPLSQQACGQGGEGLGVRFFAQSLNLSSMFFRLQHLLLCLPRSSRFLFPDLELPLLYTGLLPFHLKFYFANEEYIRGNPIFTLLAKPLTPNLRPRWPMKQLHRARRFIHLLSSAPAASNKRLFYVLRLNVQRSSKGKEIRGEGDGEGHEFGFGVIFMSEMHARKESPFHFYDLRLP